LSGWSSNGDAAAAPLVRICGKGLTVQTRWSLLLALPFVLAGAVRANATTLTAAQILSQFNAVIFGNFLSTSDVEGRTVVGGNVTGGASFDINPGIAAASAFAGLTIYGSETSSATFNINNGGGVAIGGTNAGNLNINGGGGASIGSSNTGNINTSSGSGSISVGGSNSGTLTAGNSSSVFVGGASSGGISITGGTGSVAVLGANGSTISLANGGSVYAGSNGGNITVNGGSGSVAVNGSNTGQLTLNGGGTATINGNTGNVNMNGGSLTYTGSANGSVNLNGGATSQHVSSVTVSAPTAPASTLGSFASTFQAPMTALSTQLNGVAANSTVSVSGNNVTFVAAPNGSGVAVFDVNTSLFANNSTVTIDLDGATSVIINVNVDSCIDSACAFTFGSSVNFENPTTYADAVLWNFVNATGLTFSNEFGGTVLAPLASVTNSNPIDGTLVAESYTGNGELHSYSYTGTFPGGGGTQTTGQGSSVPEPASLAVLGIGLAGLGAVRRLRRRR
jgi:choice-of-anchor A domain-containing protein